MLFSDGSIFEGQFENGQFHGYGKYMKPDGFRYEGHF